MITVRCLLLAMERPSVFLIFILCAIVHVDVTAQPHAISAFSTAQRIRYDLPSPIAELHDTMHCQQFFVSSGSNETFMDCWRGVRSLAVETWTGPPRRVLWNNQAASSWRFEARHPFCVGIKMNAASPCTDPAKELLFVRLMHVQPATDHRDTLTVHVPCSDVGTATRDTFLVSPLVTFPHAFVWGMDSLLCEVWATGAAPVRIEFVVVEDSLARDLMTMYDMEARSIGTPWLERTKTIHAALRGELQESEAAGLAGENLGLPDTPYDIPVSERSAAAEVRAAIGRPFNYVIGLGYRPPVMGRVISRVPLGTP